MKFKSLFAALSLAFFLAVPQTRAESILVPNSTFDVTVGTLDNTTGGYTDAGFYSLTASGSKSVSYNGVNSTLSETEATLANGARQVTVSFSGVSDLFTSTSTDSLSAYFSVGAYGDPMDFTSPFNLASAMLTLSTPSSVFYSSETVGVVSQTTPFNGSYVNATTGGILVSNVQNQGVTGIQLQLTSTPAVTPEPSSFVLLGTGALAMAGMVRRRPAL